MNILLATRNTHKVEEICAILQSAFEETIVQAQPEAGSKGKRFPFSILSLRDFPHVPEIVEDGTTFEENAVKKADTASRATSLVSLADDSGLEVDYLNGEPGIFSARFSGTHGDYAANNRKLLTLLKGVPEAEREARFVCVVAIAVSGKETLTVRGECQGYIALEESGQGGFGYDPVFFLP